MGKQFAAFISYSRKDKNIAEWLHSKLEHYVLPKDANISTIFNFKTKYFRPVFIDLKDLHVEQRPFTEEIQQALSDSAYLIVLCSHNSAASPFVRMEIEYFLKTHDNNLSRILPLFIDEVGGSIPSIFEGTSIMERHFPIYNTRLSSGSEANNYCFFQIISYILGIDFAKIYNRYEKQSERDLKRKRKNLIGIIAILCAFIITLGVYHYMFKLKNDEIIERKEKQIEFEKKVFPSAVVDGYEKNFITPVIKHLKKQPRKFLIYILLPENERDLEHSDRVDDFEYRAKIAGVLDSLGQVHLDTETKRGSRIIQMYKDGKIVDDLFLDFATTTSSFLEVAKFKKKSKTYQHVSKDDMIKEYANEFAEQVNLRLGRDSVYLKFCHNADELIYELRSL